MNKLNKNRILMLIKELLSGKWIQYRGKLRYGNKYRCCLGVATEVYMREVGGKWGKGCFIDIDGKKYKHGNALPDPVRKWFGLVSNDPVLTILGAGYDKPEKPASIHNDGCNIYNKICIRKTFSQIAEGFRELIK
jgi:hypothetical protein